MSAVGLAQEAIWDDLGGVLGLALEVRNKSWIDARLADVLRSKNVALALVDHAWMPRPAEVFQKLDPITADFAYIRWLGDRKGIEEQTKTWDKTIIDLSTELREWVDVCLKLSGRGVPIFAYANNHYAGNGLRRCDCSRTFMVSIPNQREERNARRICRCS
jgi:uncharacterized protein YecE (DUF72 family)